MRSLLFLILLTTAIVSPAFSFGATAIPQSTGFLSRAGGIPEVVNGIPAVKFVVGNGSSYISYDPTEGKEEIRFPVNRWKLFSAVIGVLRISEKEITLDQTGNPKEEFTISKQDITETKVSKFAKHFYRIEIKTKKEKIPITVFFDNGALGQASMNPMMETLLLFVDFAIKDFRGAATEFATFTSAALNNRKEKLALIAEDARIQQERFQKALDEGEPATANLSPELISEVKGSLKKLRKLAAATEVGVNFDQYSALVIEAKAEIEENLDSLPDSALKDELRFALGAFVDAKLIWNEATRYDFILADSEIGNYVKVKYGLEPMANSFSGPRFFNRSPLLSELWKLGKLRLDRANRLLQKLTKSSTVSVRSPNRLNDGTIFGLLQKKDSI